MNRISKIETGQRGSFLWQLSITMLLGLVLELTSAAQMAQTTAKENAVIESAQAPIFKVLYAFKGKADGGIPSPVIFDSVGNVYGTTSVGGDLTYLGGLGCGTVLILDKTGKETVPIASLGTRTSKTRTAGWSVMRKATCTAPPKALMPALEQCSS
jgi:hypothetical protein